MPAAGLSTGSGVPAALLERMRATAVAAAHAAGEVQMGLFRRGPAVRETRAHDLTLEADRLCERAMTAVIGRAFPDHAILSEEGATRPGREPWLWVLDPLDGTVNFFHGLPYFCACVSCHRRPDEAATGGLSSLLGTVAAAVFAPALGELCDAAAGRGARLNGSRLDGPGHAPLGEAVVGVSLGTREEDTRAMLRFCGSLSGRVRKLRSFGATGYDLVQVAAGRLGGLVQRGVHLWDAAAGALILEEAGGVVAGTAAPGSRWDIVAAGSALHPDLAALARESWTPSA